jgi:hypothetical protein
MKVPLVAATTEAATAAAVVAAVAAAVTTPAPAPAPAVIAAMVVVATMVVTAATVEAEAEAALALALALALVPVLATEMAVEVAPAPALALVATHLCQLASRLRPLLVLPLPAALPRPSPWSQHLLPSCSHQAHWCWLLVPPCYCCKRHSQTGVERRVLVRIDLVDGKK